MADQKAPVAEVKKADAAATVIKATQKPAKKTTTVKAAAKKASPAKTAPRKAAARKTTARKAAAKKVAAPASNRETLKQISTVVTDNFRDLGNKGIDYSQDTTNRLFDGLRNILNAEDLASLGSKQVKLVLSTIEDDMDHARELGQIADKGRRELQGLVGDLLPKWNRDKAA